MSQDELKQQSTSIMASIRRFYSSNPLIGVIGSIASVISCSWLIITLVQGGERRELAFLSNPIRTPIVQADLPKAMEVFYNSEKIGGNVTAVQVAVWNTGKKEILSGDVLKNIELYLDPQVPILDAEILQRTRGEIIGMEIDKTKCQSGIIPVTWKILENEDGCLFQIIYLGKTDVQIKMRGALIGQRKIREFKSPIRIQSASQQISDSKLSRKVIMVFAIFMAIAVVFMNITERRINKKRYKEDMKFFESMEKHSVPKGLPPPPKPKERKTSMFSVMATVFVFITLLFAWFYLIPSQIKSPFGF